MVQIEPPASPQVALGAAPVDSDAITRDAITGASDLADTLEGAQPARGFSGDDDVADNDRDREGLSGQLPPTSWQSDRTAKTRQVAMVVAMSVAGLFIAVVVFGWFVRSWQMSNQQTEQAAPSELADSQLPETVDPVPEVADSAPETPKINPAQEDAPAVDMNPSTNDATSTDPNSIDPNSTEPGIVVPSDAQGPATDEASVPMSSAEVADADPAIPADLLPQSPIIAPVSPVVPDEPEARNEERGTMVEVPDDMRQFIDLLDLPGIAPLGVETIEPDSASIPIDLEAAEQEDVDPMMIASRPDPINVDVALKFKLAFDSAGYPLSDFVLLISQASGVPIQLDWVAYDLIGLNVRDRITLPSGMRSIQQHLDAVTASIDSKMDRKESILVIAPTDESFNAKLQSLYDTADFGTGEATAVKVLNEFLASKPAKDETVAAKFEFGSERNEKLLAGIAIESLRRMRGVPGKVPDEVLMRWTSSYLVKAGGNDVQAWSGPDWAIPSSDNTGRQVDAPITMSQMLRDTARRNNATCIINWEDANRRQMSPEQLVMPFAGDDVATMLQRSLGPLGLQVRQVGEGYWWVGTGATYDRLQVVAWTSPLGPNRKSFEGRLSAAMAKADGQTHRFVHDPETDRALMLLPRFVLRQMDKIQAVQGEARN